MSDLRARIRSAWEGRISGCQLGKPVEVLSMTKGTDALHDYLREAGAWPLRDYIPALPGSMAERLSPGSCRGAIERSEIDDDINYTVLALHLLEEHGTELETADVARAWLKLLPVASVFTAERAAYAKLVTDAHPRFMNGEPAGFDLGDCADNEFNEWIGAQIRADLYGWVCPGRPHLAARLAKVDASLSHRGDGVHGAAFVAALAAAIPATPNLESAVDIALAEIPDESGAAAAVALGRQHEGDPQGGSVIREHYTGMSPVHTLNNLALVVWALLRFDTFEEAVGEVVTAGLDTDCNGATVGGLYGLRGRPIPDTFTKPWQGRVAVALAGWGELRLDDLVDRTLAVAEKIERGR